MKESFIEKLQTWRRERTLAHEAGEDVSPAPALTPDTPQINFMDQYQGGEDTEITLFDLTQRPDTTNIAVERGPERN